MSVEEIDKQGDPRPLWKIASRDFARMSDAEKAQTLVIAGLFTEGLEPKRPYRPLFRTTKSKKCP